MPRFPYAEEQRIEADPDVTEFPHRATCLPSL
jgi:hypothetical protein